jgi:hypothetical protein
MKLVGSNINFVGLVLLEVVVLLQFGIDYLSGSLMFDIM